MSHSIPVGISLAAPLERVHTFQLAGQAGLDKISVALDVRAEPAGAFKAELTTVQLGAIAVDSLSATSFTATRTPQKIAAVTWDTVMFGTIRLGQSLLRQDGRQSRQLPGSSSILRSRAPFQTVNVASTTAPARHHTIVTTVPMHLLPGKADLIARLSALPLPPTALLLAATSFLSTVARGLPQPGSAPATFVEHAIVDLLLAVLAEQTAGSLPAEATEAGTRLRIRDFILRRLGDLELGPQRIAVEFGISTRYLHRLFESEDSSVASFIRAERLKKAAGDLSDPALRHLDMRMLAARNGFAGPDQFSRAFKSQYGIAPRSYRRGERPNIETVVPQALRDK